ncbi:MAG: DUF6064 family protein [Ignavibacteriaceae bacterium]
MDFQLEPFLKMLGQYNNDIWPLQIIVYLVGFISVILSFKTTKYSSKIISAILSFFWLWNGIILSLFYWGQNYKPAYIFGLLFIIQGVLFIYSGIIRADITFKYHNNYISNLGAIFIFYAVIGYPVIGYFLNHTYPNSFPFGLVPCPTNVFTFGLFLWAARLPIYLIIIPFFWALCGIVPVSVGIYEDVGMILMGLIGTYYIYLK